MKENGIRFLSILITIILIFLSIYIFIFVSHIFNKKSVIESKADVLKLNCYDNKGVYNIEIASDSYFKCDKCPKKMSKEFQKLYINYSDLNQTKKNIKKYFKNNNGSCI